MGLNTSKVIENNFSTLFPTKEISMYESDGEKQLYVDDLKKMVCNLHSSLPWISNRRYIVEDFIWLLEDNIKSPQKKIHSKLDSFINILCAKLPEFHGSHFGTTSLIQMLINCYYYYLNMDSLDSKSKKDKIFSCLQSAVIQKSIDDLDRDKKHGTISLISSLIMNELTGQFEMKFPITEKGKVIADAILIFHKQNHAFKKGKKTVITGQKIVVLANIDFDIKIDPVAATLDELEEDVTRDSNFSAGGGKFVTFPSILKKEDDEEKSTEANEGTPLLNSDGLHNIHSTCSARGVLADAQLYSLTNWIDPNSKKEDVEQTEEHVVESTDDQIEVVDLNIERIDEIDASSKQCFSQAGEHVVVEKPAEQAGKLAVVEESFKKLEKSAEGDQINDIESDVSGSSNETENKTNIIISGSGTGNKKKKKEKGKGNK